MTALEMLIECSSIHASSAFNRCNKLPQSLWLTVTEANLLGNDTLSVKLRLYPRQTRQTPYVFHAHKPFLT